MKKYLIALLLVGVGLASCHNGSLTHPNFERTAVYFAYQTPIRTIVLGEDEMVDNTLDNEYKCQIIATIGGIYEQTKDVEIGVRVDNSLIENVSFTDNGVTINDVLPMPSNYYTLSSTDKITIPKGSFFGRLTVQLTDAFFADPLAVETNYVIPVVMTNVNNADSILQGEALFPNPHRLIPNDWGTYPKDYVLYAVKYINKYSGNWIRKGVDIFSGSKTGSSNDTDPDDPGAEPVRNRRLLEDNEIVGLKTRSLNVTEFTVGVLDADNTERRFTVVLTFDASGNIAVTSGTDGVSISGSGKFTAKGPGTPSWGNKNRDVITLDYTVDFGDMQVATQDQLVMRDRGVRGEKFSLVKN